MELITDRTLHVITRPICNEMGVLQDVITGSGCNQALQIDPVITCNEARHTESGDYKVGPEAVCENVLRETTSLGSINPATEIEERHPTLREVLEAAAAKFPKTCPACGTDGPIPTFLDDHEWECRDWRCAAIWTVDR